MIEFIVIEICLVFAMAIIFYSFHNWLLWKESNTSIIRAKVFLDKSFLEYNFKITVVLVLLIVLLTSLHMMNEYMKLTGTISSVFSFINFSVLPATMLSLGFVVQRWHRILDAPKYP
jgi:hypothetical protein